VRLAVRQFGESIGFLESTADRGVVFRYDDAFLARPGARPLSLSLPLRKSEYSQAAAMPFFSGLLPDGDLRRRIADWLHVSETSAMRLLEALGGECAGTVSLLQEEEGGRSPVPEGYAPFASEELETIIREAERLPLLAPMGGVRLSLAGAQEKIPLLERDGEWFKPVGGAPSSHILKPASSTFPDIVVNEFVCMRLALALGLSVPGVRIKMYGKPVLVEERFDRIREQGGRVSRLHQEDFCQALGIMPDRKYQADGGPGFKDISSLIRKACTNPMVDIANLVDIALFNVLVGNCDAHGKNFSILYRNGNTGLAPFYDLVATTVWPELDTKLSMKFGTEYKLDRISAEAVDAFARDAGVKPGFARDRLEHFIKKGEAAWQSIAELPELREGDALLGRMREGWYGRARKLGVRGVGSLS